MKVQGGDEVSYIKRQKVMKLVQVENYILNHKGEVWCMEFNECIFSGTYEQGLEFINNFK